ncbi:PepSY-associated TM helix domain-containing protein [Flavobacterium sp. Fl-318]|uniref:PepSY-associated TM helix domain-containing protein n=1 Tax=Flavobacterium cupriresistens TaxID=2893885 RepID=A0ABU4RG50_9FLAO|nr:MULTISPECIES: PepSY-associated TM helix domain-containing protein [unclassified Flavobacterium]MDX6190659.1 PepSY-associated TM helix domain-containing protein [Flavobacterium sp. Fl-318]UFH43718.1 PepSY domain-containing protein [Flavobacterium sp. F-323]
MNNRNYNIYFHTHTVSGIVISVVLFVIFFAGSFSFFKSEINNWERGETVAIHKKEQINYDTTFDSINKNYTLAGRDVSLSVSPHERRVFIRMEGTKDTVAANKLKDTLEVAKLKSGHYFYLNTKNFKAQTYDESYSIGEFLYRLHFLAQVPYPVGYYLSGFVALFFLFAIITGVLLHWNKIVSNFYIFRPKEKLKTLWTDAHTALGMIGLPFQFVYAVTGAFFMIKLLIVAPSVMALYKGDQNKLYSDLEYNNPEFKFENKKLATPFSINEFVEKTKSSWKDFEITEVQIQNYGDTNMHIIVDGKIPHDKKFTAFGKIIYKVADGKIIAKKNPETDNKYLDGVKNVLYRVHFGDYGGYALKIISFVLGIITCFVIISGVMIWLVARDKKNMPEKKRRFNNSVVRIYLAVCLSMYPVTAFIFIANKVFYPLSRANIYSVYFITWLLLTIFFLLKKDINFTNKWCLISGSILGFLIPIANGICTGNWFWKTFVNDQIQIFFIDIFWIVLAAITLYVSFKLKKVKSE